MVTIVGIRFKRAGKIYYFAPGEFDLQKGDHAIVETARGIEYGEVVIGPQEVEESQIVPPLKSVIRKAGEADAKQVEENHRKEKEAFGICEKKIAARGLEMNLVNVEYTFDAGRIIFYFTADGRIDFRGLVKDLAAIFRTRIELRQIGVRDEAKMLGGIGCCGRPLCCATFLGDFEPVSIRMAKEQNLSLNPTKISGICGRLLCCLKYECDMYSGCKKKCKKKEHTTIPKPGMKVVTPSGEGMIMQISRRDQTVMVELSPGNRISVSWDEIVEASKTEDGQQ
ncbi:MAG: stage 0 sporulation family protein [Acidaminococcus sp.]|nr:stage 0 sporulation family protein [Acidaminococcus sp.]MCI2099839.1 stage 0 sporulation family protein [Acidaminococcus sp.]MCI2114068.1 stage 0 sporulation family protein [Acidaminococcus sp.]MCI2115938.1 stage 0 sporulation family protein [Acidaminococcus sp.]